ncbi:hypothetical protein HG777_000728 [Salmonella enterica]|nr:hypothetical protein [Salmonella enterica]EEC4838689.1 hypothetical protein [Salmonella enterica]EEG6529459.1 hypothetical protein [Salmonella enterica]EEG7719943.1 hypothetical protein [Salmonella enterica]EEH7806300.1 hypothetical protein [Salmonella enterica]
MMKKLKEMAAISLFTLLAAGFSASVMADDRRLKEFQQLKLSPLVNMYTGVLSLIQMVWSCRRCQAWNGRGVCNINAKA